MKDLLQIFESCGFNLEGTLLTDINRNKKLILLATIAFIRCYKIGVSLHENVSSISIKTHGRNKTEAESEGVNSEIMPFMKP